MGNLLNKNNDVSTVDSEHTLQPESHVPEKHQYKKNPSNEQMVIPSNIVNNTSLQNTKSGVLQKNAGDMSDNCYVIHQKAAGKGIDPRLLTLLEFFRQLYVRRQEVFKKSIPDLHNEFSELFKKDGAKLSQVKSGRMKVQTVQRSLSVGSPRELSQDDLKLERFKVKTINLGGEVKQGGNGGKDDKTKGGGNK
ncbi:hypothetical protein FCV25MIE_18426 [Fagus crenata]